MSWADWFPAITSSTVLAVIGFAAGTAYKASVENSIQHSFDKKLEDVKATIRQSDEQISALRSGALSGLASRQANLDRRRLEAAERLWAEAMPYSRYRHLAMMNAGMDIILRNAAGSGRDAQKTREFAEIMLKSVDANDPKPMSTAADQERPFLDPVCWALFSAYRQCSVYPVMLFQLAKVGVGPEVLQSSSAILQSLKAALPEHGAYIDEQGVGALYQLLQPLEEKLLAALIASLSGRESSEAAVQHAADILDRVREADAAMKQRPQAPV